MKIKTIKDTPEMLMLAERLAKATDPAEAHRWQRIMTDYEEHNLGVRYQSEDGKKDIKGDWFGKFCQRFGMCTVDKVHIGVPLQWCQEIVKEILYWRHMHGVPTYHEQESKLLDWCMEMLMQAPPRQQRPWLARVFGRAA